jgi:hypothetical protein
MPWPKKDRVHTGMGLRRRPSIRRMVVKYYFKIMQKINFLFQKLIFDTYFGNKIFHRERRTAFAQTQRRSGRL